MHNTQTAATPGRSNAIDHRNLFRNALEETKDFVPGALSHTTAIYSTTETNAAAQDIEDKSADAAKTGNATNEPTSASRDDDTATGENGRPPASTARVIDLDDARPG
ncbi:hypothetical protein K491DRAFT_722940 [Lophiostoma macrostomum CBS 122681]|uniref:Uncharacterized protein n=1 Tax=Lophiostoma macrostomum CBS 122681 TaxID=1314788 RepID=A0A6A6SNT2_9PLEO|nr:hypothetical protein K491DRAFT_722940 [Lophiostoma macrostomum CBS 122681]